MRSAPKKSDARPRETPQHEAIPRCWAPVLLLAAAGCSGGGTCAGDACQCESGESCAFDCEGQAGCSQQCAGECDVTCHAGDCEQQCRAGGDCAFSCEGGGCSQHCAPGAICSFTCEGGGCEQACLGNPDCTATCGGGGFTSDDFSL